MISGQEKSWISSVGIKAVAEHGISEQLSEGYDARWEMELCERAGMLWVLDKAKPEVSIEIGTANGGSLSAISKHSGQVYTLDLNPKARDKVGFDYPNVEYVPGDSRETLPLLLKKLAAQGAALGFILVDGGHDTECVQADLNTILQYKPVRPLWIAMHDTFNPACRKGMMTAAWAQCPFVHFVEMDYVPGILHSKPGLKRQMWGGLALALMLPTARTEPLKIGARQDYLFQTVFRHSAHSPVPRLVRGLLRKLKLS